MPSRTATAAPPRGEADASAARHVVAPRSRRARLQATFDGKVAPYVFVAPFFLLFAVFGLFPILATAWVSLHDWDPLGEHTFIGVANYVNLLADPRFWIATRNTVSIWLLSSIPQLALALLAAAVLNQRRLRGKGFFRMALLVPNITSVVAVAIVFGSLFGRDYGMINWLLEALGLGRIDWQAGVASSHIAIATMVMWRWTGYNALIFLAGMQAIPTDLYDAAAVDGASKRQTFFRVTLPQLKPTFVFVAITSTIGGLQIFAEPLLFSASNNYTGGSSRQFSTLTLFLWEMGFRKFRFGYSAAIAWLLFLLIAIVATINFAFTRRLAGDER